jgi:two-component system CheB/CheR fusion protein
MEVRLIDDLLDVTRIVRGKVGLNLRLVDLCKTIRQAAEVCARDLEARRLKLSFEMEGDPLFVNADPARLQQVFWNLLKNSFKFTPPGGRIVIRAYRQHDLASVAVTDTGDGIEPEAMGHIFSAFAQAETGVRRKFGGLGLGLYISKAIVEMHGGSIRAYSAGRGKGATFTIKLPVAKAETIARAAPAAIIKLQPLKILLVEDHADSAKMLGFLLKTEGHEVTHAADVATALKLAGDTWCFDLLISDIGLPDATGYDLMRELTARGMEVRAIALSGYGMAEDVERSLAAGFQLHLTKPADLSKLREAMASAVSGRERV